VYNAPMEEERVPAGPQPVSYLTADLPGIGGKIKEQVEDFLVAEIPLYPPSGEGDHTFFEIRKSGMATFEAMRLIARTLGVSPGQIGHAGLKDARAVTRQVLSVQGVAPAAVLALRLPGIEVLSAERNHHKLRIGHLLGNHFTIRIRGVDAHDINPCHAVLDVLARRGVPNRFGPQRFGMRGDSARLGRKVVRRDARGFLQEFLGGPHPAESRPVQLARSSFDDSRWDEALRLFPGSMAEERRALETLIRTGGDHGRAFGYLPKQLKFFFLSAYQSDLFNRVLQARLGSLDRVYQGDLAMKHPGHSVFRVEDEAVEQPRAERFEISATGPLYGYKMTAPSGAPGDLERAVLADEGLSAQDFRVGEGIKARGERRALRFRIEDPAAWYDDGVVLRFTLPRGCYATAVLAEIMKDEAVPEEAAEEPSEPDVAEITEL